MHLHTNASHLVKLIRTLPASLRENTGTILYVLPGKRWKKRGNINIKQILYVQ